jgi:hypothetical protein
MQNVNAVSRPTFHVLSNGALVFAVSLRLYTYRKMNKTIHRSYACIRTAFSAYITQLTEKPSPMFQRAYNSGLETD